MGCNASNVIKTVEVMDHKDRILGVLHTLTFIAAMLVVLAVLKLVNKWSVKRRRDNHPTLEKIVSTIPQSQ